MTIDVDKLARECGFDKHELSCYFMVGHEELTAYTRAVLEEAAKACEQHRQELFHDGLSADLHGMSNIDAFMSGCEQERSCITAAIRKLMP